MRTDSRGFPSSINVHIVGDLATASFRLLAEGVVVLSSGSSAGGCVIASFIGDGGGFSGCAIAGDAAPLN